MSYEVVFDVSQRLPQLAIGLGATVVLVGVIVAGILDTDAVIPRGPAVFVAAVVALVAQWLVVGEWPLAAAATIVGTGVVLVARSEMLGGPSDQPRGTRRLIAGMFLLVFVAGQGLPMVAAIDLDRRLGQGEARVVEGTLRVEPFGKTECLAVASDRFCVSMWTITPGYNRGTYLVGPPQAGQLVRLSIIDGLIVRFEVAQPP